MRRHPRRAAAIVAVTALTLLIAGLFGLIRDRGDETGTPVRRGPRRRPRAAWNRGRRSPASRRSPSPARPAPTTSPPSSAQPVVAPAPDTARISGETATQPDLYAAEFVRRLLTQRYDQPRAAHLAWVQAESAPTTEPLVVGLVPERLRDRLAVYSVTTGYPTDAPVPDAERVGRAGPAEGIHHRHDRPGRGADRLGQRGPRRPDPRPRRHRPRGRRHRHPA